MSTKYIFLDIDGTLVNFDCTMPESTVRALKGAQARGHKLILATGRFVDQIYPFLFESVDFDGIIASSGAAAYYGGKRIYERYFTREQLGHLSRCIRSTGACFCTQTETHLISSAEDMDGIYRVFLRAGVDRGAMHSLLGDVEIADMCKVETAEKVIYYDADIGLDGMRRLIGDDYNIDPFSFKNMPGSCGEINLADVSKATAIRAMMAHLGASMEDTIAFGDGGNDAKMLRAVGLGVAMGNALPEIKAAADMVTDDIGSDGLYNAFLKLGLI